MSTSQPTWYTFHGAGLDPDRFTTAWVLALATYGVGDVVTTIALVWFSPSLAEANPIVASAIDMFGGGGFLGLKLLVFYAAIGVSLWGGVQYRDRLLIYGPPIVLSAVGVLLAANNLWLVATVH